jgi:ABC-type branched-subunit amino acid transport system substrate-binding protein
MTPRSAVTRITILLAAAVVLALGCAPAIPPEAPWEKDARALLDHAETLYARKQYNQALKTAEGFLATYPTSRYGDRALALMGEVQISSRNYAGALRAYKELIEKYPASSMIAEAKYKIGLCFYELKEYDLAIDNLSDRSRITDPAKLQRIAEMLSTAYLAKGRNLPATRELAYLAENAANEKQRPGYRDRVRELVDRSLTADELRTLADATAYPADLALLRLAALEIERRQYADALASSKAFLTRFPNHPEKTRAEMLSAEATVKMTAPRYQLGVLVPQTGPASFFGDRVLKGIQLAVLSYNTQNPENHVELIVKDTEGLPDKAAAGFTELVGKGVVAVVGPLLSREVEALVPALNKSPIPVFTPTASGSGITELSPWIFRNALTNAAQAVAAAEYGIRQKAKKFVIIHPDDPYGRDLARIFTREVGRKAEILATISYPAEANDFGPYIRRLIEIDLRSQKIIIPDDDQERKKLFQAYSPTFDALYLPGSAEKVGLLLPQLAFYNVKEKIVIGSNNWHTQDLVERAGLYAEGAVFVDGVYPESEDPAVKTVVDAYRSAYQEEPDILSAQAYDAAAMVLTLLKERKDAPAALRDGLLAIRDYPGISGTTSFTGNGDALKQLFLIKIENGKFTLVTE